MYTNFSSESGPPRSAERRVYDYLLNEIISGRLPSGTAIRQEEVAAILSLSRIPVRDALRHLAAEGFVSIEANRRVVVTQLESHDLLQLYEMRAVLEGLAARHAASRLSDAEIERLAWLAELMDKNGSVGDQYIPVHDQFHEILYGASGMPRLIQETRRLHQSLQPQVLFLIRQNGVAELTNSHHSDLVKVVRTRDPERVEQAVRTHVQQAATDIISAIDASRKAGPESAVPDKKKIA